MAEEVIIFARSLPFHHLGGMEVVAWDLAVQLQVKGFKVTVVTTDFDEDIPVLENTPQIIKLKNIPKAAYSPGWWAETEKIIETWRTKDNVSAVISISAGAFSTLKHKKLFPNAKFIMQAHGTSIGELVSKIKTRKIKKILSSVKNILGFYSDAKHYSYFDWVVAVGDAVKKDLTSFPTTLICSNDKVVKIENGIDEYLFSDDISQRNTVREQLGISFEAKIFLSASRLHEQKGVDKNIDLFAEIKKVNVDAKLLICGDGPYEKQLRKKVDELKLNHDVIFLGAKTRADLAKIMQGADIFLFLTKRVEGLPLNVLEAMSSGLPLIISEHLTFNSSDKIFKCNPNHIPFKDVQAYINTLSSKERRSFIPKKNTLSHSVSEYTSLFLRNSK
ncbi:TPA: glycosyltransferase family 4 protein [Enterobacter hormaechei subsp. steigerwaltii]|uniref:glycosyltransferase family 4 protein n=1 Tax=Enterobacter sp. BA-045-C-ECC TaxID=3397221 RepID=UPI0039DF3E3D|nr:glycosyltransferase family 4 protein [Enterobacter hormaechei subsp. steigerwaltii]